MPPQRREKLHDTKVALISRQLNDSQRVGTGTGTGPGEDSVDWWREGGTDSATPTSRLWNRVPLSPR